MEHKKLSVYLKAAGVIAGIGGVVVFFLYAPIMALECRMAYPELAFLFWPGLIFVWCLGGVYAAALWQYWLICHRIGKNRSFCSENARGLSLISRLFFLASGMSFLCMGAWLMDAWHLGPGWLALLLVSMASAAVGVLAWALGKLLQRAVSLQEENDLTI